MLPFLFLVGVCSLPSCRGRTEPAFHGRSDTKDSDGLALDALPSNTCLQPVTGT